MSNQSPNSLKRSDMLKHDAEIQEMFRKGHRSDFGLFFTVHNIISSSVGELKVFFSVPKRLLRKAVSRNLVKRKMRESVRKNLSELSILCQEKNVKLHIGFVYSKNDIQSYSEIEEKIILSLQNIITLINNRY